MRYFFCLLPAVLFCGGLHAQKLDQQKFTPTLEAKDLKAFRTELCKIHDLNATDAEGHTPLYYIAAKGNTDAAKMAVAEGADINKPGKYFVDEAGEAHGTLQTPLHIAAQNGHLALVEFLLSKNAKVEAVDEHEETPLHLAARAQRTEVIKTLLKAGAQPEHANGSGHFPLNLSIEKGDTLSAAVLIGASTDLNQGAGHNAVPLAQAIHTSNITIVKLLLESGANVNVRHDSWGNTPLHLAASKGKTEIVRLLLDKGADRSLTDNLKRLTPMNQAEQALAKLESDKKATKETIQSYKDTIKLLKKYYPKE